MITIAGIQIPSVSPVFLTIVGFHVVVALICVVTGIVAMLTRKRRGRHSTSGAIYFWCLLAVFLSATALSAVRWKEDYHLFILGGLSFVTAILGRAALRNRWRGRVKLHISGMGLSYIVMLTAFYVDNGKNLPVWRDLPPFTYWVLPAAVGIPLIMRSLLTNPLARSNRRA